MAGDLHDVILPARNLAYPSNLASHQDATHFVVREMEIRRQVIEACTEDILNLYTFQNTFAPVNHLPPEIFSLILAYFLSPFGTQPTGNHADFVKFAHVCRHWRAVALGDPSLWTSFPVHHPVMVEACLARSRDLPVMLSLTKPMAESIPDLLASSSHRVRSIWISTKDARDVERLLSCFTAAHSLELLHVDSASKVRNRGFDRVVEPSVPILFNDQVPSLRHLALHDVQLFFTPPNTLRHLELFAFSIRLQPLKDLLEILANCPELQDVKLHGQCGEWERVDRVEVQLPKLQSLSLQLSPAESSARLLSQLSVPEQTHIRIKCLLQGWEDFEDIMEPYSPEAPHSLQCLNKVRKVEVQWSDFQLRMLAGRDDHAFTSDGDSALEITATGDWGLIPYAVPGFFDGNWPFDGSHVEELGMTFEPYEYTVDGSDDPLRMGEQAWSTVLGATPTLKFLTISHIYAPELEPLVNALSEGEGDATPCPKLESLELRELDMSQATMDGMYRMVEKRLRKEPRSPMAVVIHDCGSPDQPTYYGDEWAMKLMRLGVKVTIDGNLVEEEPLSWADVGTGDFSFPVFCPYRAAAYVP